MNFRSGGSYPAPTTGRFNMCNCTLPGGGAQPTRQGSPESHKGTHRSPAPPVRRTKKIALDPAESSAIYDAPCLACLTDVFGVGEGPVGAGTRVARSQGSGATADWGTSRSARYSVVQASLRCCGMPASRARTSASR
ncbi:hypothetical protein GCM10010335_36180 [Streptomyces galbus]|nr:hypothetical protein GCM10010335_36180 [Streptomyces galbus]